MGGIGSSLGSAMGGGFLSGGSLSIIEDPLDLFGTRADEAMENQQEAARNAAQMQYKSEAEALDFKKEQFEYQKEIQEPWMTAGKNALDNIVATPDFEFTAETFEKFKDPSYNWRVEQGVQAIDASASSKGNLFSGATQKEQMRFGQDMATQEFGNSYNRAKSTYDTNMNTQKSLAGVGQQSTNQLSNASSNVANSVGQNFSNQGNALAQGEIQSANAFTNKVNSQNAMAQNVIGTAAGVVGGMASDIRLKKNITFIGNNNGHRIYSWEWKDITRGAGLAYGVIAQEVEKYMPEAITTMKDGFKAVFYDKLNLKEEI